MKTISNILESVKEKGKNVAKTGILVGAIAATSFANTGCTQLKYHLKPNFLLTASEEDKIKEWQERKAPKKYNTFEERYKHTHEYLFFTCKDWVDENHNGNVEWEELKGVRNYFKEGEIFKSVVVIIKKGGILQKRIINPQGKYVLGSDNQIYEKSRRSSELRNHVFFLGNKITFDKNDCEGRYIDEYFLNGRKIGEHGYYIGK